MYLLPVPQFFTNDRKTLISLCWGIDVSIPAISKHSLQGYWAFAQHCRCISTDFFIKRLLTVLTRLTSAKLMFISCASSLKDSILAVVLSLWLNTIAINCGLLSFCRQSSVYSLASISWDSSYVEQKLKSYLELHQRYSCRKHVRSLRQQIRNIYW